MLKTRVEKFIHRKYGTHGADGRIQCYKCPLRVESRYSETACRATHSWNKVSGEWEPDDARSRTGKG